MTKDAKFRFLTKLEEMAEALYQAGDSVSHDATWEHRRNYLWGYCSAGKTIELVGAEEIQHVIDRAHLKVYGEARSARAERLKPLGIGSEAPDWDAFDEPTLSEGSNRKALDQYLVKVWTNQRPSSQYRR